MPSQHQDSSQTNPQRGELSKDVQAVFGRLNHLLSIVEDPEMPSDAVPERGEEAFLDERREILDRSKFLIAESPEHAVFARKCAILAIGAMSDYLPDDDLVGEVEALYSGIPSDW